MPSNRIRHLIVSCLAAHTVSCSRPAPTAPSTGDQPGGSTTASQGASATPRAAASPEPWLVATPPDLRSVTLVVHVVPPPDLALAYADMGARHRDLGPLMKAHNEGGFGSGFLIVARGQEGPEPYVVTNQHVVGLAITVGLDKEGSQAKAPAQVIHIDPVYDLAILRPSPEAVRTLSLALGLAFAKQPPRDQNVVIAAGFPGIQGAPSYQVTRGHVSNERVLIEVDGQQLAHIQHTAAIDPGSSGGPLLNEHSELLGINTLKLRWREGVGLAVPATVIREAIERVRSGRNVTPGQAEAQDVCERLLRALPTANGPSSMERLLGAQLVAKEGARSLWLLPEGDTNWPLEFVENPARVMATAIGRRLHRELGALDEHSCRPASTTTDARPAFTVEVRGATKSLVFAVEQGSLKLVEFDFSPGTGRAFLGPKQSSGKKWKPSL